PTTDADCTTPHRSLPSSPTRRSSDLNISLAFTGTSHSQHHRIHWCYVNHIKTSRTLRFIPRELPCVIDVFSQRIFFTNDFAYTTTWVVFSLSGIKKYAQTLILWYQRGREKSMTKIRVDKRHILFPDNLALTIANHITFIRDDFAIFVQNISIRTLRYPNRINTFIL